MMASVFFFISWEMGCFLITTFSCVLLHEFGHCLAAKKVGWNVKNVHLFPIGGVAQIDMEIAEPKKELFVTACGPLVNLVLAPIFLSLAYLSFTPMVEPDSFLDSQNSWCLLMTGLGIVNSTMLIFNLLPIFPMDGGRIFRSTYALLGGNYVRATKVAVRLGQVGALVFGAVGLWFGIFLWPVVAVLLMFGAEAELRRTLTHHEDFLEV